MNITVAAIIGIIIFGLVYGYMTTREKKRD
jgi:hypothetical protein